MIFSRLESRPAPPFWQTPRQRRDELTHRLLAQGRRRPLLLVESPSDSYWQRERRAGYGRAMREAGVEPLAPLAVPAFPVEQRGSAEHFETIARLAAGHLIEALRDPQPVDAIPIHPFANRLLHANQQTTTANP